MIDQKVIEQCVKGKRRAQKKLYHTFAKRMFWHCYRYIGQKEDTEEVVGEGFVKVFHKLSVETFRDSKSFEGWIRRIMINESLLFLRKQKFRFEEIG